MKIIAILSIMLLCCCMSSVGQYDSSINKASQIPFGFISKINKKISCLENSLTKQSEKYLRKLKKQEEKLKNQFYKIDSNSAKNLFLSDPIGHYNSFLMELKCDSVKEASYSGEYLAYMDSMKVTMNFLKNNSSFLQVMDIDKLDQSIAMFSNLQGNLSVADRIKDYVDQRKVQIKQYLLEQSHLPSSLSGIYKQFSEDVYYYANQIQGYKEALNDPDKVFKIALQNLNKLPVFQEFMQKNSYLGSLFPSQDASNILNALNGLQTRNQTQQMIQTAIPFSENAGNSLTSSVDKAKSELDRLQDKYLKYGQSGQAIDDPNFKPNMEKNKTFLNRLEYGTNFQTQGSSNGIPATLSIGISVGYKLQGSNVVGVGVNYLVGLGKPINHIHLSTQGIGYRSFLDIKLKGSFYASGGFEYNQVPLGIAGQTIVIKKWQSSGLIGLSKIVDLKYKVLKKTKVQLLWNFLSYYQTGPVQPIVFRVGYGM